MTKQQKWHWLGLASLLVACGAPVPQSESTQGTSGTSASHVDPVTTGPAGSVAGGSTGTSGVHGTAGTFGASGSHGGSSGGGTGGTHGGTGGTGVGATGTTGASSATTGTTGTTGYLTRLTVGAWDDNLNFAWFTRFLDQPATASLAAEPHPPLGDRLLIRVEDTAHHALAGATVTVSQGAQTLFQAPVGAEGLTTFQRAWDGAAPGDLEVRATVAGQAGTATAHPADGQVVVEVDVPNAPPQAAEVGFVVDATGSMGDELGYLQAQIAQIAVSLTTRYPAVQFKWGGVVYRDDSGAEEYVTRDFPLTAQVGDFAAWLAQQAPGGGGDYEEIPEVGLDHGLSLGFSQGNAARLLFHIADAPHHPARAAAFEAVLRRAHRSGVHVYPISASGADLSVEYELRLEAQLTGGRYLFLTDDSGIGGPHEEPHIPCYFVTTLSDAVVRMVRIELEGQRIEPAATEILRAGGDPQDGACALESGTVFAL